jgi:sulfur relay (sulfurtransferase) complex TusBCD TusD component (DsrE family)
MTNVKQYPKSKFNNKSTLDKMYMSEYADIIINLANDYIELNDIKEVHVMKDGVIMQDKKMKAKNLESQYFLQIIIKGCFIQRKITLKSYLLK